MRLNLRLPPEMSDYPGISAERQKALMDSFLNGARPLAELLASKSQIKGADAQTLRNHFSSYALHPAGQSHVRGEYKGWRRILEEGRGWKSDIDGLSTDCKDFVFAAALMTANLVALKKRWTEDGDKAKQIWEDCESN